jgi:hypothetical protein
VLFKNVLLTADIIKHGNCTTPALAAEPRKSRKILKTERKRGREEKRRGEGVYERHHVGGGGKTIIFLFI